MRTIYILITFLALPLISDAQGIYKTNGLTYDEEGNLLEGKYVQVSDEDQTKKVYHFNRGLLNGECMIYASNGNLLERGKYIDGQKHGKWSNWNMEGRKTGEVKFDHGQRDGKWQIWDENGVLRYVMFYEIGEKVGVWKVYSDEGKLLEEKDYSRSL